MSNDKSFVVMRQNGDHDDKSIKPIRVCTSSMEADRWTYEFQRRMAHLEGKLAARDAIMTDWRSTAAAWEADDNGDAHQASLDKILEIQKDVEGVGFKSEHELDHPAWYVVEVMNEDA